MQDQVDDTTRKDDTRILMHHHDPLMRCNITIHAQPFILHPCPAPPSYEILFLERDIWLDIKERQDNESTSQRDKAITASRHATAQVP
jgi:hypothetical protein